MLNSAKLYQHPRKLVVRAGRQTSCKRKRAFLFGFSLLKKVNNEFEAEVANGNQDFA